MDPRRPPGQTRLQSTQARKKPHSWRAEQFQFAIEIPVFIRWCWKILRLASNPISNQWICSCHWEEAIDAYLSGFSLSRFFQGELYTGFGSLICMWKTVYIHYGVWKYDEGKNTYKESINHIWKFSKNNQGRNIRKCMKTIEKNSLISVGFAKLQIMFLSVSLKK